METTTALRMTFGTSDGKNMLISLNYADGTTPAATVKELMDECITNNDIFVRTLREDLLQ